MQAKPKEKNIKKNVFSEMEEQVLDFWQKNKIFKKSVKKEASKGDYVFYDGPPFITGLPHYGSLLPSIAKDVIPRYQTMKGYRVERIWGWDCHGLPAENQVEKELELKNKKDIEELGVDKFVEACRKYVSQCSSQWKWYIDRIGRWVDMDNAYRTMDQGFMESVIWAFKKLYDDDLIYEGYRSSLHCPRCATPLSKFEITMDAGSYRDITEKSVVIKFKLKNEKNIYILAWTTTPWTLPGNLSLAVGKSIDYVKIKIGGDANIYILAKERLGEILKDKKYEIVEEFKGKDLIGLEYEPLFDLNNQEINSNKNAYKIYAAGFVSTEDGTGIVHIAPNFGEDDFEFGKANNLPLEDLMDESGIYSEKAGPEWEGEYFKKAGKKVLENLGDKLFLEYNVTHSYPFCHRCNTSLIYKTQKAWYLNIEKIRKEMIKTNKDINWIPEHFKEGRFQYNLENAPDWCVSRSRYWGTPLPVWKCGKCGNVEVYGSIKEIEEKSGQKVKDLHRPDIDEIKFKCEKCENEMIRIKEVFDSWFDSGAMPFAQFHYPFKKKDEWKDIFPADFIIEYTGQLRGWFYSLHVLSNALFKSISFKNVIVTGVLAGNDGRKMSKSLGNYPDPKLVLDKYGSDALRMYFMSSPIMVGGDLNITERDIQDSMRKNIIVLWNVVKFYEMFSEENNFSVPENLDKESKSKNILDQWILSKLNQLIEEETESLEKYDLPAASRPITNFVDDLSTWYLRRSRDRFKGEDEKDKQVALETTSYVLLQLSKLMAPFMPFLAEQIWQKLTGNNFEEENKSVHLEKWIKAKNIDEKIIKEMEVVRKIVELGLAKRDEANIKVRQPLKELKVKSKKLEVDDKYVDLIKDEVNVKEVIFEGNEEELKVELNTELTDELKQDGIKRELVRFINALRKQANLTIKDTINIYYKTEDKDIKEVIKKTEKDLLKDTLAKEIRDEESDKVDLNTEVNVNGIKVWLGIRKI